MADLPLDRKTKKATVVPSDKIEVTHENADLIAVHFLSQIYARLGYVIKLLEGKK